MAAANVRDCCGCNGISIQDQQGAYLHDDPTTQAAKSQEPRMEGVENKGPFLRRQGVRLEDLQHNASARGILPHTLVAVVSMQCGLGLKRWN